MKRLLIIVASVAMLGAGAGWAFAGKVKGPPTTGINTNDTAAPDHANSACAFSGLNDNEPDGQTESQVQTAADSWKYYFLPKGTPGILFGGPGLCRGGTN